MTPRRVATVREATSADVEDLVRFNRGLADKSGDPPLDEAVLRRGVARALRTPTLARVFVAERDGARVGCTMVTYELTDWRDGLLWWVQSVYVVPEARG